MKGDMSHYKAALAQIAEIASAAGSPGGRSGTGNGSGAGTDLGCSVKALPTRLQKKAALLARTINPVNGPLREPLPGRSDMPEVQRLTVSTAKYWGPILVGVGLAVAEVRRRHRAAARQDEEGRGAHG